MPVLPTYIFSKPRHPRKRRSVVFQPPGPSSVTVVSVAAVDGTSAIWVFSAPVTLAGSAAPELQIDAGGAGFVGPDSVSQGGPSSLVAFYGGTGGVFNGDAWRIVTAPPDISPAVAVPESGDVL